MAAKYEPIGKAHFRIEQTPQGEMIRVRAPRQPFLLLFLPLWLLGWTIGGGVAIYTLVTNFQIFVLFWLCFWAIGWVAAVGTLMWMLTGSETLCLVGQDIEIAHHAMGISRRWLYQGSQISRLSVSSQAPWAFQWQLPFSRTARNGSIKFNYGPRTIYAAAGLEEGGAQMVVDRLAARLPRTASAG